MGELAEIARAEEEHWAQMHPEIRGQGGGAAETRQAATLRVGRLSMLPLAAERRLVRRWLEMNAPDSRISFRLIEEALELARGAAGKKLEVSGGRSLRLRRQELWLESEPLGNADAADYEYSLAVPGVVEVPELGASIEARVVDAGSISGDERGELLDLARMPKEILIRNWRAGDRYWPAHTVATRKVKELLSDRHATGVEKKLWPVAVAKGCGLIWMRGFAVPAAFQAATATSKAIWIREIVSMM